MDYQEMLEEIWNSPCDLAEDEEAFVESLLADNTAAVLSDEGAQWIEDLYKKYVDF